MTRSQHGGGDEQQGHSLKSHRLALNPLSTDASGVHGRRVLAGSRGGGSAHLVLRHDLADSRAASGVARSPRMGFIGCRRGREIARREQGRCLEDRPGDSYDLPALVTFGTPGHGAIIAPSASLGVDRDDQAGESHHRSPSSVSLSSR